MQGPSPTELTGVDRQPTLGVLSQPCIPSAHQFTINDSYNNRTSVNLEMFLGKVGLLFVSQWDLSSLTE